MTFPKASYEHKGMTPPPQSAPEENTAVTSQHIWPGTCAVAQIWCSLASLGIHPPPLGCATLPHVLKSSTEPWQVS